MVKYACMYMCMYDFMTMRKYAFVHMLVYACMAICIYTIAEWVYTCAELWIICGGTILAGLGGQIRVIYLLCVGNKAQLDPRGYQL